MSTLAELEKKRAELREKKVDEPRAAQLLADTAAILELEVAQDAPLHTMTSPGYKPGAPVRIAFRAPTAPEYKRYCDTLRRMQHKGDAKGMKDAQEMLAACCLVYPAEDSDARAALLDKFPGTLISLAIEVAKVAELEAEAEGKG